MPDGIPLECRLIEERCQSLAREVRTLEANLDWCREHRPPQECTRIRSALLAVRADLDDCETRLDRCVSAGGITNVHIADIEITQAIQFFNFNGRGSGFAADNSVPLVANKPTILRVYVDRTELPQLPIPQTITGRVICQGRTIRPLNAPIAARASSTIERGNRDHTLNFWIPPELCSRGSVSFDVRVSDSTRSETDIASSSRPVTIRYFFDPVPRLRIHIVLIRYTGRGQNIAPLTLQDVDRDLLPVVRRCYPISDDVNITAVEELSFNGDLTLPSTASSACGTGWDQLTNMLRIKRSTSSPPPGHPPDSTTRDVFVGFLPPGVPTNAFVGCGGGGVAAILAGVAFSSSLTAHELGHALGRMHAPCPRDIINPDNNFPSYWELPGRRESSLSPGYYPTFLPTGGIGEFGFDTIDFRVFDPATTSDFMSYCKPRWISPYTYINLKNAIVSMFTA
jgi:hypothetical protein